MVSNFALLLSQDGIKLAYRTDTVWTEVGTVPLNEPDLASTLEALRKKGEILNGGAFSTKIVLPDDQVKYLTLSASDDDETRTAEIEAALERATPYLAEELAYDWEESDDGLNVAAVARVTLNEAEQFAVQHGFNPLGFVATPDDKQFSVEPFFGPTQAAEHILGEGSEVEAELSKVVIEPVSVALDKIEAPDEPEEPAPDEEDAAEPESSDEAEPEVEVEETEPDKTPSLRADRDDVPDMGFTPRLGSAVGDDNGFVAGKRALDDPDLKDEHRPEWVTANSDAKKQAAEDQIHADQVGWIQNDSGSEEEDLQAELPPSWMGDHGPHEPDGASDEDNSPSWVPPKSVPMAATAYDRIADGTESLSPSLSQPLFADQNDAGDRNYPLIIAALVIVLLFIGGGIFAARSWFFGDAPTQIAEPAAEISVPVEDLSEPDDLLLTEDQPAAIDIPTQDTTVETSSAPATDLVEETAEVSELEEKPALSEAEPEITVDQEPEVADTPTQPDESETETSTPVVVASAPQLRPSAGETPATAEEPEPVGDQLEAGNWEETPVFGDALEISYAATGIWPVAPIAPSPPGSDTTGDLYLTTLDPELRVSDAVALATISQMMSDRALSTVPNPPPLGSSFNRDDRGLVKATAEGALTPDGAIVFAGTPPIIPPLAPGRPDPQDELAAQRSALEGKEPALRPDSLSEDIERDTLGGLTRSELAGKTPKLRPPEIAEIAATEELLEENPLALSETPTPRLRPSNMAAIVAATEQAEIAAQTTRATRPSAASVTGAATIEDAIPLRDIALIGVYGDRNDRRALIRLASGRYVKVEVGSRVDGGTVTAIDTNKLYYSRNGKSYVLEIPGN